ncbi:MAG: helix-turn-helix domain-containing protein [Lachnospiraceae bacterium]|nr:helix-turn-helix domain-containing protein [Lachnospiraceae bacterium]
MNKKEESRTDIPVKGYLHEDFRLFHNTDTLGTDVGVHFHTFYKVTFVKYGAGSYMIDGRMYDIRPCDIILVGINVPHQPSFEAGELYDRYTLYISSSMLEKFDIPDCHIYELFSSESGNVVRPDGKEADHFVSMMEKIDTETRSSSYAARLAARLGVIGFLIETGRCREESSLTVPLHLPENDKMLNILRYINDNLSENITIADIASRFYMSKYHMMRSFKNAFGCPMHEYIINRRLTRAREMIMQGTAPAEACYSCGYGSYSAFARAYSDKYGVSPRKTVKESTEYSGLSDFLPE